MKPVKNKIRLAIYITIGSLFCIINKAMAESSFADDNQKVTEYYRECRSATSKNSIVMFYPWRNTNFKIYAYSPNDGDLKPRERGAVVLFVRSNDKLLEETLFSTNSYSVRKSAESDGYVETYSKFATVEDGWRGFWSPVEIDTGKNTASLINEYEGTKEIFNCSGGISKDYINGVFQRFEERIGISQVANKPNANVESESNWSNVLKNMKCLSNDERRAGDGWVATPGSCVGVLDAIHKYYPNLNAPKFGTKTILGLKSVHDYCPSYGRLDNATTGYKSDFDFNREMGSVNASFASKNVLKSYLTICNKIYKDVMSLELSK